MKIAIAGPNDHSLALVAPNEAVALGRSRDCEGADARRVGIFRILERGHDFSVFLFPRAGNGIHENTRRGPVFSGAPKAEAK